MPDYREIPLTKGKVALVDAADFESLNQWSWQADFHPKWGTWYARRTTSDRKKIYMHRIIMDAPRGIQVDHEDGDGLHNWRGNLRLATNQQNNCNKGPYSNNSSGHKGVTWHKAARKWEAWITVNYRKIHLGLFEDLSAAVAARGAAQPLHGKFARTEPFTAVKIA